jgi:ubiquinone/menaquinone biosynthesis C-methylase UbiE
MLGYINNSRKKILRKRIENDLKKIKPKKVLDNGCSKKGSWDYDKTPNLSVVGIDKIYGDSSLDLKFKAGSFDCVVFAGVIQYLTDPVKAIKECYRVLKKRGHLIISTINSRSLINSIKGFRDEKVTFTQKELGDTLKSEKFKIVCKDIIDFKIIPKSRRMVLYYICKKA